MTKFPVSGFEELQRRSFLSLAGKGLGLATLSSVTVASLLEKIEAATKNVSHTARHRVVRRRPVAVALT